MTECVLELRLDGIPGTFGAELRKLSVYGSLVNISYMDLTVEGVTHNASPGGKERFECLYRL